MAARVTQGKCSRCRLRYEWRGRPLLRRARCPRCKHYLERTSRDLKRFRTVVETPLEAVEESRCELCGEGAGEGNALCPACAENAK